MNKKHLLLIGILFSVIVLFIYIFFVRENTTSETSHFVFSNFIKSYPDYLLTEERLTHEKRFNELGQYFEGLIEKTSKPSEQAYLEHVAARAYVNAVTEDNTDKASLEKAIGLSKRILSNEEGYQNLRAYTIDVFDRLFYSKNNASVKRMVIQDAYFKQFLDANNQTSVRGWRTNFLNFGDTLYPVTNIRVKIALLETEELLALQKKSSSTHSEQAKQLKKEQVEGQKKIILYQMNQAEDILKQDYAGNAPFKNPAYIVEPLLNKAIVAEKYFQATKEVPFGEIDTLYQGALAESKKLNPLMTSSIEQHYNTYIAKKSTPLP